MATIPNNGITRTNNGKVLANWQGLGNADDGAPIDPLSVEGLCFQIFGTFGGATVTLQGSNDGGVTWGTLVTVAGAAATATSAALITVATRARWVRPLTSGGTGTDVDVYMSADQRR